MARWIRLAAVAVVLVLLVQELHAQDEEEPQQQSSDRSVAVGGGGGGGGGGVAARPTATKTYRRRYRVVRRRKGQSQRQGGDGEGEEVVYQRNRVATAATDTASAGAVRPGRRRRIFSRVNTNSGDARGGARVRVRGRERVRGGGAGGVAGGAVALGTGGVAGSQLPDSSFEGGGGGGGFSVRRYSSSRNWTSGSGSAGGTAGQETYGAGREPDFPGSAGTTVRRTSVSRHRVTTIGAGGTPGCPEGAACATGAASQQAGRSYGQTQQTARTYGQTQQTGQSYGSQTYDRSQGVGQSQLYDRTQGVGQSQIYDRFGAGSTYGRTYDRSHGRLDTSRGGGSVVTRYPGRTFYRNATGTFINETRTLPDGRVVTTYNYMVRDPVRRGGVITARNTTTVRNRTTVTTTTGRLVPGGTRVEYSNTTSVVQFPTSVTDSTIRRTTVTETSNAAGSRDTGRGSSVTGSSLVTGSSSVDGSSSSSDSGFSSVRPGSVTGRGSSMNTISTTLYRNESRRLVSSGTQSGLSNSERTGVQGRRGGRGRGSWRGWGNSGSSSSYTNTTRRVNWSTSSGSSTSRRVEEKELTWAEMTKIYTARNRLRRFGECQCNMLGTDPYGGPCDASTGQCNCLANVEGKKCDRCIKNHWKIAIGDGCEPCACDPVGSVDDNCNEYDGRCSCRPGFGGRRCNQCQANHWGNPREQCFACECDAHGSADMQCDRDTGYCPCREGMGGEKCDQCARGFKGRAPYCDACGECFDNWDRILTELRERTEQLRDMAGNIKKGGASGVYQPEFDEMQGWLDAVSQMLGNATVSDDQVLQLQSAIDQLRSNLTESEGTLREIDENVDDVQHRVMLAQLRVPGLRARADRLDSLSQALEENATLLQEANVDGALKLTTEAQQRSQAAEARVLDNKLTLSESERQRRRTENLLSRAGEQFNQSQYSNQQLIDEVNQKLGDFEREIPGINSQVCDGEGDPCDALCGGAGCDKCGGISCDNGAVTKAASALAVAENAADILLDRERQVDELLRDVTMAKRAADEAHRLAEMAFTGAELNSNRTSSTKIRVEVLLKQVNDFLAGDGASPQAIRDMAEEALGMTISLRPEQITELARQINETIASLTNIQDILDATAEDLDNAKALKRRADAAKSEAERILETAESVMSALQRASTAQEAARVAMASAEDNIEQAETDLTSIASEAGEAQRQANESLVAVLRLGERQRLLTIEFSRNELDVRGAVDEAKAAGELATEAQRRVAQLEEGYQQAVTLLAQKEESSSSARDRARQLLDRANKLSVRAGEQVSELREINSQFTLYETQLRDLSDEVMTLNQRMEQYLNTITSRAEYYRTCQS